MFLHETLKNLKNPSSLKGYLEDSIKGFAFRCDYRPALLMILLWTLESD